MIKLKSDIISLGCLSGELQTPVAQLSAIAVELGVSPSIRIDNVPHYSNGDAERIAKRVRAFMQRDPAG